MWLSFSQTVLYIWRKIDFYLAVGARKVAEMPTHGETAPRPLRHVSSAIQSASRGLPLELDGRQNHFEHQIFTPITPAYVSVNKYTTANGSDS